MFRFTIRDLLWLMVVVGMGVTIYCERQTSNTWRARTDAVINHLKLIHGEGVSWKNGTGEAVIGPHPPDSR